ncbi:MAG: CDP-alcohol phosphatidyltransferase family protein [Jatrophihabitans sp.]|uniref:CDP-alcohol phosphatidyltransferase family protein n=1 Tax=Jatrophihabitans sp. TaxID=1932789 RepID=UPI003F815792
MSAEHPNAVRVVLAGADPGPLAGQLAALDSRRRITVTAFTGMADLPTDTAFALVSTGLRAPDDVLLRLLDDPALTGVAALVAPPADGAPADVLTAGAVVQSAGSAVHAVTDPDSSSLRAVVVPVSLAAAAVRVLAAIPAAGLAPDTAQDTTGAVDLALVALVRSSLGPVTAVRAEPLPARRDGGTLPPFDPQAPLRSAARPGDGFWSTFVLRRISARLTPWFVRHGIAANAVTVVSFLLGAAAGPLFACAGYPGLVAGAVLLQLALVLDCVDGEIARATRTRSALGAWLDGATDRVKEYGALAGLAVAAGGARWWLLAGVGLAVQTVRHVQDHAFDKGVLAEWRSSLRDRRPLADTTPWHRPPGTPAGPDRLTGSPSIWLRRVLRMPIAERWLVLSVAAAAHRPGAGLVAYAALTGFAWLFTVPGAVVRARRLPAASAAMTRRLTAFADPGIVPMPVSAWTVPVVATVVEYAAVLATASAASFAWAAAVAWHRYDVLYRGGDVPPVVGRLAGGWPLRAAVAVALAVVGGVDPSARHVVAAVLVAGALWLAAVTLPESLRHGVRTARSSPARVVAEAAA